MTARSGDKAWDYLQAEDGPRLAVLDWMMPGMDGVEICRLVRAQRRSRYIYLVVLTSNASPAGMIEALDAGADDYVTKPFQHQELRARLRAASRILELEAELEHRAHYDLLTDLPNRALLEMRFQQAIQSPRSGEAGVAMLFIDLDEFKLINDSLGHATGDLVLREVAKRLAASIEPGDTLSRVGGDEFVSLARNVRGRQAVSEIATAMMAALNAPISAGGEQIYAHASIGISMYPEDGADFQTLQKKADAAMFVSKRHTRGKVRSTAAWTP